MKTKFLILNGLIVSHNKIFKANIYIENERIARIDSSNPLLKDLKDYEVIDATDKYVFPGLIDTHVHFREPGLTHKGDIYTESLAALAGGVTTFFDMPNTKPPTVDLHSIRKKFDIAKEKSFVNYSFYLGATKDNFKELQKANPQEIAGIKFFYASSTGNMLLNDSKILERFFKNQTLPYVIHSEDNTIIEKNTAIYKTLEKLPYDIHFRIRSKEACLNATNFLIKLARKFDTKLHFLHVSTAEEIKLFENLPASEKKITAETCPNYLWFDKEDFKKYGNKIKCNPSIKTTEDKISLRKAIYENRIDTIGTDHAPHLCEEKNKNYFDAPSGIPSIQFSLLILLELARQGYFPLWKIAEKTSYNPSKIFGIKDRGEIKEGFYADLVIVSKKTSFKVTKEKIFSLCKWSPFENTVFKNSIFAVFVNGFPSLMNNEINYTKKSKKIEFVEKRI